MAPDARDYAPNIADACDALLSDTQPAAALVGPGQQEPVDPDAPPALPAFTTEQEAFQAILNEIALIIGTADAVLTAFQQGLAHPLAVIQRPVKQVIVMRNPPKANLVGIVLPGQSIAALKVAYGFLASAAQEKAGSQPGGLVVTPPQDEP